MKKRQREECKSRYLHTVVEDAVERRNSWLEDRKDGNEDRVDRLTRGKGKGEMEMCKRWGR